MERIMTSVEADGYVFENAEDALKWAVEVLRRRRLPKMASFWREIEAEADEVVQSWQGSKNLALPQAPEERLHFALQIMEGLKMLEAQEEATARLLKLWAWGDWVDEGRLRAALAIQETCRREGVRVRIAYRYSYAQLGVLLGCDKKTVWREVQNGLCQLQGILADKGIVLAIPVPEKVTSDFKKHVYKHDFKSHSK